MNLSNKVALVTGGSGDIGSAICRKLSNSGATIIVHYNTDKESAFKTVDFIKANGGYAVPVQFDIKNYKSVFENLYLIYKKFNKIDILVNNSGTSKSKLFIDITEDEWDEIFDVNVKGIFNCTQFVLKNSMLPRKYGKIINMSSIWGICGASCESHYSATKAAIIGLTKSLAKEFGPSNINVNAIAPGVIKTKMLNCYSDDDLNALLDETPINRLGTPEDIANCVDFLASDEASFITGQVISPNGGFVI